MSRERRRRELQARAHELYVPNVFGYVRVAKRLHVHPSTVRRWLNPRMREASNDASKKARSRRTGICEVCGGPTRYNPRSPTKVGRRCRQHALEALNSPEALAQRTLWPRERIIKAIQLWQREHGRTPTMSDWRRRGERHPSTGTVVKRFGSWNAAIEAAGFEPRIPTDRLPGAWQRG